MKRASRIVTMIMLAAGVGVSCLAGISSDAAAVSRVVVTGNTDIRVWVDDTWDVYPSYGDVTVSIRAARDCYATVFVVDTEGYIHVVYPFSPHHNSRLSRGHVYRYTGFELGLNLLGGRGIAYVFAVGSPDPFDYGYYDDDIYVGRYGYRVFGDPFVASRDFYISMLPARCNWGLVTVSSARFYIGEWVRYPAYLCCGHDGVHVRVGTYCNACAHIYDGYRRHVSDPCLAMAPRAGHQERAVNHSSVASIRRTTREDRVSARTRANAPAVKYRAPARSQEVKSRVTRSGKSNVTVSRVVSTNRTVADSKATSKRTRSGVSAEARSSKVRSAAVPRSGSTVKKVAAQSGRANTSKTRVSQPTAKKKAR